jgi:hypothetical protein
VGLLADREAASTGGMMGPERAIYLAQGRHRFSS